MTQLILPFPPSVNGYWSATSKGMLISARGRLYRTNAIAAVYEQLKRRPKSLLVDLDLQIVLFPPTRAKRDLDNFQKALFDSLTHAGVWGDDSQIKRILLEWGPVMKGGKVHMKISNFEAAEV